MSLPTAWNILNMHSCDLEASFDSRASLRRESFVRLQNSKLGVQVQGVQFQASAG